MSQSNWQTPEFLRFAVKHGLLSANAGPIDAYALEGALLRDATVRQKRLKMALTVPLAEILTALTPAELASLKESHTGVLRFKTT